MQILGMLLIGSVIALSLRGVTTRPWLALIGTAIPPFGFLLSEMFC